MAQYSPRAKPEVIICHSESVGKDTTMACVALATATNGSFLIALCQNQAPLTPG